MHIIYGIQRPQRLLVLLCSILMLVFVLAGCGSNVGSGAGGGTGLTPTPTAKPTVGTTKGYGTSVGCPSDAVITNAPAKANVIIQMTNMDNTVTAYVGDVIEVRLPFGHKWGEPGTAALHGLDLQSPAGYAWKAENVCIWRFTAKEPGTTQLLFHSQALCKPGELCPMYITAVPFTVVVK